MKFILPLLLILCVPLMGDEKADKEKFEKTKALAEKGDAVAQYNVGMLYAEGQGVEQDIKKAFVWFSKAADQGYAKAQYYLGVMYANGQGVEGNFVNGYAWLNIAASNGEQDAKNSLPQLVKLMTPEQIAKAQELSKEMVKKNPKLLQKQK